MKVQEKMIGTWRLIHGIKVDEQGNIDYPMGKDAYGYIMYDNTGHMAVQIYRVKQNQPEKGNDLCVAYCGKYEIDEAAELVSHIVEGADLAIYAGKILQRKYHFYDNKLSLKPWDDGTDREILWEKVEEK